MPYHILRHIDWDKLLSIVHRKRVTNEFRRDHGSAAPCFHDLLFATLIERGDLFFKLVVDEWSFLQRTCHVVLALRLLGLATANDVLVRSLAALARFKALGRYARR